MINHNKHTTPLLALLVITGAMHCSISAMNPDKHAEEKAALYRQVPGAPAYYYHVKTHSTVAIPTAQYGPGSLNRTTPPQSQQHTKVTAAQANYKKPKMGASTTAQKKKNATARLSDGKYHCSWGNCHEKFNDEQSLVAHLDDIHIGIKHRMQ